MLTLRMRANVKRDDRDVYDVDICRAVYLRVRYCQLQMSR